MNVKIKMLKNYGLMGKNPLYKGKEYELTKKEAENLVKMECAREVKEKKQKKTTAKKQ